MAQPKSFTHGLKSKQFVGNTPLQLAAEGGHLEVVKVGVIFPAASGFTEG